MTRHRYKDIILAAMPGSQADIARKTGMLANTVWIWIKRIKAETDPAKREAHITDWRRPTKGGPFIAVWTKGPGEDVPCELVRLPLAETSRAWRERQRKSGEMQHILAKRRLAGRVVKRDPFVAALFGPTAS